VTETTTITADGSESETDPSPVLRDRAGRSENRTIRSIRQQFRAAIKALLDDEPPPAAKKRRGETGGAFGMAARIFSLRSLARSAFRTAKGTLSRSRPAVAAVTFLWEVLGPPNPCDPFNPVQPLTEDHAGFGEPFAEALPPPDYPSANL
jgi:hypothetical protein